MKYIENLVSKQSLFFNGFVILTLVLPIWNENLIVLSIF